jgi:tetratricopeptide (TPR) repeat protein
LLEQTLPALHRVFSADPDHDAEPCARAFSWFHRGRLEIQLPAALGRKDRAVRALELAIAAVEAAGDAIEPAARARIDANARLALGRHWASAAETERARILFAQAASVDPEGTIGRVAEEETARLSAG